MLSNNKKHTKDFDSDTRWFGLSASWHDVDVQIHLNLLPTSLSLFVAVLYSVPQVTMKILNVLGKQSTKISPCIFVGV